jgi:methyl coenzyme M reductase gamma subunit
MEITSDLQAGPPPWPAADHPAGQASPDEAAVRTRELYAQYAESVRESPAAPAVRVKRARRTRSRARGHATEPTHQAIAVRAYELYAASGYPHGRDVEFWLEAERELRGELEV